MFRSFAITIRPKSGVKGDYDAQMTAYIKKQLYSAYVYEGEAESRHIHAQIFFDKPKRKNDVQKQLCRIAERTDPDWSTASRKVLVSGVKVAYNNSFLDNYMSKENECEFYNPPLKPDEYYPSESEQEAVMARANAKDDFYHHLKELWGDHELVSDHPSLQLEEVSEWVFEQMYVEKTIKTIPDTKRRKLLVQNLYFYLYPHNSCHKEWMLESKTLDEIRTLKKHLKTSQAIDL